MVVGVVTVADSRPSITDPDEYERAQLQHRIPREHQAAAIANRWTHPWVFKNIRVLPSSIRYAPQSGQQTWVTLSPHETDAVEEQLSRIASGPHV